MKQTPVVFLDSGVGGLPYCDHFAKLAPQVPRIYIADRANFPYGPKSKTELSSLLQRLIAKVLNRWPAQVVVIACNTATISSIDLLRSAFPTISFVGTVPAVKPAVLSSSLHRIGVIATERTIREPYIYELTKRFAPQVELVGLPASELVSFVEHEYYRADQKMRLTQVAPYVEYFKKAKVDGIVLGCTHFLFLIHEFKVLAEPEITIFHSLEGVGRRVLQILENRGLLIPAKNEVPLGNYVEPAHNLLVVTGSEPVSENWQNLGTNYGLSVEVWE